MSTTQVTTTSDHTRNRISDYYNPLLRHTEGTLIQIQFIVKIFDRQDFVFIRDELINLRKLNDEWLKDYQYSEEPQKSSGTRQSIKELCGYIIERFEKVTELQDKNKETKDLISYIDKDLSTLKQIARGELKNWNWQV